MKRYGLDIAVGIIALSLSGCATVQREYPVSDITVDNSSSRTYTGSEEEAIRRMMDLAIQSSEEDAWLSYEKNGKTYFVDIGAKSFKNEPSGKGIVKGERVESEDLGYIGIQPDPKLISSVLRSLPHGTKVRFYHIHPVDGSFGWYSQIGDLGDLVDWNTFPSSHDISKCINNTVGARLEGEHILLPDRVVGPRGYVEYAVSETVGMEPIDPFDPRLKEKLEEAAKIIDRIYTTPHFQLPFDSSPSRFDDFIGRMGEEGISLKPVQLRPLPLKILKKLKEYLFEEDGQ